MARLWYGQTPADFAVALGASQVIPGSSPSANGRAALVPEAAVTLDVYNAPGGTQVTDLLNEAGVPISALQTSTDLDSLGTIPQFQGPDSYTDDLWVTSDDTTFFRLMPSPSTLFDRLTGVELALETLSIDDLVDVTTAGGTPGQVLTLQGDGTLALDDAGSGSVSSVNGVSPVAGAVTLTPANIGAAPASGQAAIAAIVGARLLQTGGAYPARPSAAQYVDYIGTVEPVTGVQNGDKWFQPVTS